ncbi:hypothetical protein G7046_g2659 [Stylonectria norvegica]|nr:hypothetical protein G7046_g2659 [Stylonectria norvegica]
MNVTIVGASGETGKHIVNGLLESPTSFKITAFVRPASINKPGIEHFKKRGVTIVSLSFDAPHDDLVEALKGQDVLIAAVDMFSVAPQIALADAAKAAGVKRFLPSAFATPCAPRGVLAFRDMKEEVVNHVKKIYLPYTIVDIGTWYQGTLPRLPSGKIDYAINFPITKIQGDGDFPTSLTDLRDIGRYVARIIVDERTLNKYVFAYDEVWTQEAIFSLLEKLSGEKLPRNRETKEKLEAKIEALRKPYDEGKRGPSDVFGLAVAQILYSIWFRGDNLPESAQYLGYLNAKELYPDFEHKKFEDYVQEVVGGRGDTLFVATIHQSMSLVKNHDKASELYSRDAYGLAIALSKLSSAALK